MSALDAPDLEYVSRIFTAMLAHHDKPVIYHDRAENEDLPLAHEEVASPLGLLPAFLLAGEAVWFQATGNGFALDIVEDHRAAFGYAVRAIRGANFSAVMLSMLDVLLRIDTGGAQIYANELNRNWDIPKVPAPAASSSMAPGMSP